MAYRSPTIAAKRASSAGSMALPGLFSGLSSIRRVRRICVFSVINDSRHGPAQARPGYRKATFEKCSPDEAERNPGKAHGTALLPDYACAPSGLRPSMRFEERKIGLV